jgi:glutaminyl-tRNA synthetase
MPTLEGMRRRGFTPESIRNFCDLIGVTKQESVVDVSVLEECVRNHLNQIVPRVLAVLHPLKIVIENFPEDKTEELNAPFHPNDPNLGERALPFSREIYIEQDDFMENPPKDFFRLSKDREVRLRYAYFIKCHEIIKDEDGNIVELRCTYDPATRGGNAPDGRKVKGTIHWVSKQHAKTCEVRLYDRLFNAPNPGGQKEIDYRTFLNPNSLKTIEQCFIEPSISNAKIQDKFQFERLGYFCVDKDSTQDKLIFNRTVSLKDTWAKINKTKNM